MENILVAIDFSDIALHVLDKAAELALAFSSKIHLLHVSVPSAAFIGNEIVPQVIVDPDIEEKKIINTELQAMTRYFEDKNIAVTSELADGPVSDTILAKAAFLNSGLIIIGAHRHGFVYRAFIGSVSSDIIKNPPCPVMIVPEK
jgi:nucleotide-binding universal stress UspA family protein